MSDTDKNTDNNKALHIASVTDPFIMVKLRKSEIEELKSNMEFNKWQNGASTDEGKYCTKLIKRFEKALNGR